MKKSNFLILVFLTTITSCRSQVSSPKISESQNDLLKYEQLIKIDIEQFKGKKVSEIFQHEPLGNYQKILLVDEPPGKLSHMLVVYFDAYLMIYVKNYKHIKNRFDANRNWPIEEFLKEEIEKIELEKK